MYRASSRTIDGILLSEFRSLVKFYECSLDFQQRMVEKLFIAFDSKHRGYITKDDFQKVSFHFFLSLRFQFVENKHIYQSYYVLTLRFLPTKYAMLALDTSRT